MTKARSLSIQLKLPGLKPKSSHLGLAVQKRHIKRGKDVRGKYIVFFITGFMNEKGPTCQDSASLTHIIQTIHW
jgi:hypothetical protein